MATFHDFCSIGRGVEIYDPHISCFLNGPAITVGDFTRIDGNVKLEGGLGLSIGAFVHIGWGCHLGAGGGKLTIGDHAGLASGVRIASGMPDLDAYHITPTEPDYKPIRMVTHVGEFVFIGMGAIILPGVVIGDYAMIGAGSVVTRDIPAGQTWAGNPAQRINQAQREPR